MTPKRETPRIDLGDLTEVVMASVRRALEERQEAAVDLPPGWPQPRIWIGITYGPILGPPQPEPQPSPVPAPGRSQQ
jgi:hypothetical protein